LTSESRHNSDEHNIDRLIVALEDKDPIVRSCAADDLWTCAADDLGDIGKNTQRVATALCEALRDRDDEVRKSASEALDMLCLGDEDTVAECAVPALAEALSDSNDRVRYWAASALWGMGSRARQAVGALSEALEKEEDAENRRVINNALAKIGSIHYLISILKAQDKEDFDARDSACESFLHEGLARDEDIPTLIEAIKDNHAAVRLFAAEVLYSTEHQTRDSVCALIEALDDENSQVRNMAANAFVTKKQPNFVLNVLEEIKPKASFTVSGIMTLLTSGHCTVCWAHQAERLMAYIGKAAVPICVQVLGERSPSLGQRALIALERIGPLSQEEICALLIRSRVGLHMASLILYRQAAEALCRKSVPEKPPFRIGDAPTPDAKEVLPPYIEALKYLEDALGRDHPAD